MQNGMRDRLIKLLKTPNKSAILRKANPQFSLCLFNALGKTVFLTKGQAEMKLRELNQ